MRRTRHQRTGSIASGVATTTAGKRSAIVPSRQQEIGLIRTGAELPARPRWIAEWSSVPAEERRLYARMMEVYAAFLAHTDHQIGRVLDFLRERGLLDDTLVIFGTEFGRTSFAQGALKGDYGRDHHGSAFSLWMAGGGIKAGQVYGETDDFSYNIVKDGVHIHDLNATILRTLGVDHTKLTYRAQGRDFRLTDVAGKVVAGLLA